MTLNDCTELELFQLQEGLSDAIRRCQESARIAYDQKDWDRHARRVAAIGDLRETYASVSDRWHRVYGGAS